MSRTRPLRVENPHFLLDLLHGDTAPLQQYRELTQNAIEAVLAALRGGLSEAGEILWTFSRDYYAEHEVWKLMLVDTGVGMSADEMQRFINQLVCSSKPQGLDANYGVGARITAGAKNPVGVVFQSWKDGEGAEVQFWKDPKTGTYGLRGEADPDGNFSEVFEPESKPEPIGDHGTAVILLGEAIEHNTCLPPTEASQGALWLSYYLNTRYFRFPEEAKVRVHEFNSTDTERWDPEGTEHKNLRQVMGAKYYLDKYSDARGTVPIDGAVIHWWILEEKLGEKGGKYMPRYGHVGALWKDELYDVREGKGRNAIMNQFGVLFGGTRVVLYAEPTNGASALVRSDAARRHLTIDHQPLPWERWAEEFKAKFPPELDAYQKEMLAKTEQEASGENALRDRLKQIRDLLKIRRYRPGATGGLLGAGEDAAGAVGAPGGPGVTGDQRVPREPRVFPARPRPVRTKKEAADGKESAIDTFGEPPEVIWVSLANGTRDPQDGMEDRAARYVPGENRLLMNADFRGYTDLTHNIIKTFGLGEEALRVVRSAVREEAACMVIEAILGLRTLEGAKLWDLDAMEQSWSPESLTAVVMVRFHAIQAIKRKLGSQLGKLRAA